MVSYHPAGFQGVNDKIRDAADMLNFGSFGMMLGHPLPPHLGAGGAMAPPMMPNQNGSYSIDAILGIGQRPHPGHPPDKRRLDVRSSASDVQGQNGLYMDDKKTFDLSPLGHRRDGPDSPEALSDISRHGKI